MARPSPPPSPGRRLECEMDIHVLGIDLGKNSCSVVGLDLTGRVLLRRRMRRESIVGLAAKLPGCVVAMEACCGVTSQAVRPLTDQGVDRGAREARKRFLYQG